VNVLLATAYGMPDAFVSSLPTAPHFHVPGLLHSAAPTTVWIVVLAFVFLECAFIIGLFLPGDSLLFAAGVVLAAHDHEVSAWWLALAATIAAVAGNQVGYLVGRRTGTRILARKDSKLLNRENLAKARAFCDKWGFWSVAMARWMPWIRTLAPIIAGAAGMDNRRYLLANTLGALLWVPTLLLLGYYCAGVLDSMPWLRQAATIGSVGSFLICTGYGFYRYRQEMAKPIDDEDPLPAPPRESGLSAH
jgi:membrane-associated protein